MKKANGLATIVGSAGHAVARVDLDERVGRVDALRAWHKREKPHISKAGARCHRHQCSTEALDPLARARCCPECWEEACAILGVKWTERWNGPVAMPTSLTVLPPAWALIGGQEQGERLGEIKDETRASV
jgi:hypothetical protein